MIKINKILHKLFIYWLPVVVWAFLIFSVSSNKVPSTSSVYTIDFVIKKIAHLIEYAVLSILIFRALKGSGVERKESMIYAVVLVFIYAVSDEFHQSFTPTREPTLRDVIIDTLGASFAMLLVSKLLPKTPRSIREIIQRLELI